LEKGEIENKLRKRWDFGRGCDLMALEREATGMVREYS